MRLRFLLFFIYLFTASRLLYIILSEKLSGEFFELLSFVFIESSYTYSNVDVVHFAFLQEFILPKYVHANSYPEEIAISLLENEGFLPNRMSFLEKCI